ncbi:GNAT family N-acetyltransferase [Actinospica durhamensis]|uniref:GNAT family N-acetyltransferase n=1 Tax=Actinospica durhamensis TaxID=1508375 RepID=A0A941IS77_9ACTN|nr:GNAT family N-acetyltransferase [Actinospica durhamensis]MBR7839640.1 GNAT family N-acetyltransferase [Actinospica durhamensis]
MHFSIEPFVPARAGERDLRGYYNVTNAIFKEADPHAPQNTFETVVEVLRATDPPSVRRRFWIARGDGGDVIGLIIAQLPSEENAQAVVASVRVLPAVRGRGVGSGLLRAMVDDTALIAGRSRLVGFDVVGGSAGDRWAAGLGFERTQERVLQVLHVAELDSARWNIPVSAGFFLEAWSGAAPERLVAQYALARSAIADAPTGDSSLREPQWTAQRVREHEAFEREAGRDLWVVAAVEDASSRIVGMTEMSGYPEQATVTSQRDTAVLAEFRGNGLGRAIKAAMMRTLSTARPHLERVLTTTASDNKYMIAVNHDLGYVTARRMVTIEGAISEVRSRLGADDS